MFILVVGPLYIFKFYLIYLIFKKVISGAYIYIALILFLVFLFLNLSRSNYVCIYE